MKFAVFVSTLLLSDINAAPFPQDASQAKDPLLQNISGKVLPLITLDNESRKQERANCVYDKIDAIHKQYHGTKNVLIVNAKNMYTFSSERKFQLVSKFKCNTDRYHNRPFPYKVYVVEPDASVTRKGDGGYVNWAYKHRDGIVPPPRKENDPTIKFI